jgi:DNA modification methylase
MRDLIAQGTRVQMCVTSPPYWGLRDYGTAQWDGGSDGCDHLSRPVRAEGERKASTLVGTTDTMRACEFGFAAFRDICGKCGARRIDQQLGLEPTPEAYVQNMVEVFQLVRELLADDGVLFLNLGDSYATGAGKVGERPGGGAQGDNWQGAMTSPNRMPIPGLKPKDLVGIPWSVAKALQSPYYTGRLKLERDRVWLAAMIDGEGTICGFDHDRADNGTHRSGIHVFITNSCASLLDEAQRIWPTSRSEHGRPGPGHLGDLPTWRWIVHGIENKLAILRELYPYLIAKREQAIVAYSMLLLMANAKRLGHSSLKDETIAKRAICTALLSDLNHQRPVTMPNWLTVPPSCYEPGWYLRQDIIWSKPNPMPESVTDRCTKAHEYLFLLSKRERYYYDAAAIAEPFADERMGNPGNYRSKHAEAGLLGGGPNSLHKGDGIINGWNVDGSATARNRRSVWTVTTQPYAEAHFATFPPALIEPCIMAGSRTGDVVLDPFMGSGTTGEVAQRLGRQWLGCELNPAYEKLQKNRTAQLSLMLA